MMSKATIVKAAIFLGQATVYFIIAGKLLLEGELGLGMSMYTIAAINIGLFFIA
ncbi:MAG: hypothetical protein ACXABY_36955 [Candidatus Thorarchaeota archaeon]|jgi:hypothetical protein